jgi:CRP-like cAMP-binding protein
MRGEVTLSRSAGQAGVAQALRRSAMRRTLGASAGVMGAEWALIAALSVHAYSVDGALAVGLLGLRFVPAAVVGLVAPRFIERRQPAEVLRLVAVLRALAAASIAVAVMADAPFAAVLAVVALDGAVSALYRPAQSALLPSLAATAAELAASAGLIGNIRTLSQVTGAFVGGLTVVWLSVPAVAVGAACLMAVAAVLVPHSAARATVIGDGQPVASPPQQIRRRAVNVAVLATIRALVRGLWLAMVVVVAIRLIDLGASGVGVLMAASAAGALVALPIAIRLVASSRLAVGLGLALTTAGAPLAALAAWHAPAIALVLIAVHGIGMAVAEAASLGLLHRLLDARGVARLVGPMESAKLGFEGAGSLLAPGLLAVAGTRGALVAVGAVPVLLVALDWPLLGRIDDAAQARTGLVDLLREVDVFHALPVAGLEEIASGAQSETYADGDEVIRQGEPGDKFYVVASGGARVLIDGYTVAELSRGQGFGERALMRGGNRAATVTAVGDLTVQAIRRDIFLAAVAGGQRVMTSADFSARTVGELLPGLPLFAGLSADALRRTAERFEISDFPADNELVCQGESGDRFYMLLSGSADVLVDGELVGSLIAGDGFGEIALLHDVPRRATVRARSAVRVATLQRAAFTEVVPAFEAPALA